MSSIKINNINNPDSIQSIGRNDVKQTAKSDNQAVESKGLAENDKVKLSSVAQETGKLIDQLKELPDVRQDRVAELKQQISSGSFQPTGTEIAEAILKDEKIVNG